MKLARAQERYKAAAEKLMEATEAAFPVGAIVTVTLGKSRIIAEVLISGGCWWHEPAKVCVRNIATGKVRHFLATSTICEAAVIFPNLDAYRASTTAAQTLSKKR